MHNDHRFAINAPGVMHQHIDDEILVVHLERGHYFSLRGPAAVIWSGFEHGLTAAQVQASLEQRFEATAAELEEALREFADELVANALIVGRTDGDDVTAEVWQGARELFAKPVLTRYWDIEELLKLDPIHEVDADGWPQV